MVNVLSKFRGLAEGTFIYPKRECLRQSDILAANVDSIKDRAILTSPWLPEIVVDTISRTWPKIAETLGEVETLRTEAALGARAISESMAGDRIELASEMGCSACSGIVVDPETALMYCGKSGNASRIR